jgi:hypothetical protein
MKDFDSLSLDERAEVVISKGKLSESLDYFNFQLQLYILPDGSFAEIWYSPKLKDLTDIKLINDDELQKWLNRIRLPRDTHS